MDNKNDEFERLDFADDFFHAAEINAQYDEEERQNNPKKKNGKNKLLVIAVISAVAVIAIVCGVYFGFFHGKEERQWIGKRLRRSFGWILMPRPRS